MEPAIHGYRGHVRDVPALLARLRAFEATHACRIQLARADRVHGADHLRLAALLASRALAAGRARAADLPTETLVYAAGERQVKRALEKLGLASDVREVAALAWGPHAAGVLEAWAASEGLHRDDVVLAGDERSLAAFGVTPEELAATPPEKHDDLVLERVALVDVLKA